MLAFSCFSMSPNVLPFKPSFQALVLSMAIFMTTTVFLVNVDEILTRLWLLASKLSFNVGNFVWELLNPHYMLNQQRVDLENTSSAATRLDESRIVEEGIGLSFVYHQ